MISSPTLTKQNLQELLDRAKAQGADGADVLYSSGLSVMYRIRNQAVEHVERAEGAEIGLRVFQGRRQVVVSSGDVSEQALKSLVTRAMEMVAVVPEDPFCGLADPDQIKEPLAIKETFDPSEDDTALLIDRAKETESAALSVLGVSASEGAESSYSWGQTLWMNTLGFYAETKDSTRSLCVSVIASQKGQMERDYAGTQSVFSEDLKAPAALGSLAGARAVERLGGRRIDSCQMPVIFDPRESHSLLRHLASAINGSALTSGTSFLKDKLEKRIFHPSIQVCDDPHRPRGFRSRGFDAEGLPTQSRYIIEKGVLTSWILDLRTGRQLSRESTGHAVRSPSGIPCPSVSNFYIEPGLIPPRDLIASVKRGIYITELIGDGVNMTTGDYSRGATGFMIENGVVTFPVHGITIAGNLLTMFEHMSAADDLTFQYGIDAPTLMVEEMIVAGE